jgi:hypothetical protein
MVHFQRTVNTLPEKIFELSSGEGFFKFRGKRLATDRTIGATARPKTGFYLIALDLILHVFEIALLARAHMLQSHFFCAATIGLFFHALLDALPHKEGHTRDGLLCLVSPIHNMTPPDRIVRILH